MTKDEIENRIELITESIRAMDSTHIVLDGNISSFKCTRCGEKYKLELPMALNLVANISYGFMLTHLVCGADDNDKCKE